MVAIIVALVVTTLVLFAPRTPAGGPEPEAADPTWAPPVDTPPRDGGSVSRIARLPDAEWVARVAAATGIPERALAAYAGATIVKDRQMPECGLSWTTLAGIAATESDHGRHGGATVREDGSVEPPIFGVALDGGDTEHIPDSDDGAIDGDDEFDRAVGPFQLIPQTWRNWHVDANGDGVEDPHHIDDAALATANYLCRAVTGEGLDFTTEEGWRAGVAAFNSPESYLASVARHAERYADAVR